MKVFDNSEFDKYKEEVKEKWGNTDAFKEYSEKMKNYSKDKQSSLTDEMNNLFGEFSACMKNSLKPDSENVQNLVKRLQNRISYNYYHCTPDILSGLGQMYVSDERFRENIDKNGVGTAEFVSAAITAYCKK